MGIYKVQSNGKAPYGLGVGDYVVTGGGTYVITSVNADGSYNSHMFNQSQTTYNYSGSYSKPGSSSSSQSSGKATPSGAAELDATRKQATTADEARNAEKSLENYYLKLLDQAMTNSYTPVSSKSSKAKAISFAEAVDMAEQVMKPQYEGLYQLAADNSAQRLDRAGLYDTLYGQSLAAEAETAVSRDLNSAIYALALQLSQASDSQAQELLNLAVQERQFGANYDSAQKKQALDYLLKLLQG